MKTDKHIFLNGFLQALAMSNEIADGHVSFTFDVRHLSLNGAEPKELINKEFFDSKAALELNEIEDWEVNLSKSFQEWFFKGLEMPKWRKISEFTDSIVEMVKALESKPFKVMKMEVDLKGEWYEGQWDDYILITDSDLYFLHLAESD